MGFSSGLPFFLTGLTLKVRLTEAHLSYTSIGLFGLVGLSYNLKFLWAPLIDHLPIPLLGAWLGRRRSWLLAIQLALMLAILGLGASDPAQDVSITALWAVAVAFLSASQDIVIDAFRIELLADAEQGAGVAATQVGYRFGLITAGAGALFLVSLADWPGSYAIMAALVPVGGIAALFSPERPAAAPVRGDWLAWLNSTIVAPFADFVRRHRDWLAVLAFISLYHLGEAIAGEMSATFYLDLGVTRAEYASVSKLFGVIASLAGVSVGGAVVYRFGVMRALMLGSVLQIFANLTYLIQLWAGHDIPVLFATIGIEQATLGLCGAALVAFLSRLCSKAHTATQYALLSALSGLAYRFLGSAGGYVVDQCGWAWFFVLSAVLVLPSLFLLLWLMRRRPAAF
jgi:PAT family beta-lactamase induction signal transducer AmpG